MGKRNIIVKGDYIAAQHIDTQILHADHVHYAPAPSAGQTHMAEDVDYEEVRQGFPLLTDQCHKENKVAAVEAQLKAACQGTAVELWRVMRLNEALGYMAVSRLNTRAVYNAIQDYFGPLPYSERNFRDARNKK